MLSVTKKLVATVFPTVRRLHRLTFQLLTEEYYEETLNHLKKISYKDVPIYKAANLIGKGISTTELDDVYYNTMKEGVSVIALKDNKFAGAIINGILTPEAIPTAIELMKKSKNEDYKKMDYMFLQLLLELNIFERFGINRAMECRLISSSREYRGSGLGKVLVDKLTEKARELNFPLIIGEAVNAYLLKLLLAEGWTMARQMPYSDYIDEATGKSIYKVDPPHHILGVTVRIIDERCKSRDPLPLPNTKIYYPIKMD